MWVKKLRKRMDMIQHYLPVIDHENVEEFREPSPSTDSNSSETGVVYQAGRSEDNVQVITNGQGFRERSPSTDSKSSETGVVYQAGRSGDNVEVVMNGQGFRERSQSTDSKSSETGAIYQAGGSEDNVEVGTNGQEFRDRSPSTDRTDDESESMVQVVTNGELHAMGMDLGTPCRIFGIDEVDGELTSWHGVRVKSIALGGFAHGFGLQTDDRLLEVNGQPCTTKEAAIAAFTSTETENLKLTIQRWETTVRQIELSRYEGMVVTEVIDVISITKCRSVNEDHLDRFTDGGPEEVKLKASGRDKSLYVVAQDGILQFRRNIPPGEVDALALFQLHNYWDCPSHRHPPYPPVVIQHKSSRLCVKLENENVVLKQIPNLDTVPCDSPFVFRRQETEENSRVAFFCKTDSYISIDNTDGALATAVRAATRSLDPNTLLTIFPQEQLLEH